MSISRTIGWASTSRRVTVLVDGSTGLGAGVVGASRRTPTSVSAEIANVAASIAKPSAGPSSATSRPPIAGPASWLSCVAPEISAFPACSSPLATSVGTIASEAGMNIPSPAPSTTAITIRTRPLAGPGRGCRGERSDGHPARTVRGQHHVPRPVAVACVTAEDQQRGTRHPICGQHRAEAQCSAVVCEDIPRQSDQEDPVTEV